MVYLFYIDKFLAEQAWPGTHEPPSASERVAQRFERSENAIGVAAGLMRYGVFFI